MRHSALLPMLLLVPAISAPAQVSISIGLPHLRIGINLPTVPELVRVPDSPVLYAPAVEANYFFYDGMYWVFREDNWYASSWYNGPWSAVHPEAVPDYVLRIPVSCYRQPPAYFRAWRREEPPRWGEHWGGDWARRRVGWDRWDRRAAPAPARVPEYQREFRGDRYPAPERQTELHRENYRYEPREPVVRDHYQRQDDHRREGRREDRKEEEHRH